MTVRCRKCGATTGLPLCVECGVLQMPPEADHFALLGLEQRYDVPVEQVEARQRELSRLVHPDRFAMASPEERRLSLLWATSINDAVKTLRDPIRRAEYMLRLRGIDVRSEQGGRKADPGFLMEMLELREELQTATRRKDDAAVQALVASVEKRRKALLSDVEKAFAEGGAGNNGEAPSREALERIAKMLEALRYLGRFLEEALAYEDRRDAEAGV